MTAFLLATILSASAADTSSAQPVVRFSVSPAAVPKPTLKYQLLPEVRELKPGNPAQWYLRCFAEQRTFFFDKQAVLDRARYRTVPLKALPAKDLRHYGGHALTQADWAARLDAPDWQVLDRVQSEGADIRLPELGPLRELAYALQVRFRGEVAGREFDDAIVSAKTMLAFARHLGAYPTLSANQLGLAVQEMAIDTLAEMIQQPGCPNLYWALTDLPCPLVELRKGAQGERVLADAEIRSLRDDAVMTDAELEEVVRRVSGRVGFAREEVNKPPRNLRAELTARTKDASAILAAQRRLLDAGMKESTITRFSALQMVLLDERLTLETRRDDEMKLLGLKLWEVTPRGEKKEEASGLFADLVPRVRELHEFRGKLEQRIALLRCVEAIRMFAATHGGKLPTKLSEVSVPVPVDPFTGKPFGYRCDGTIAKLTVASKGEEKGTDYEITIAK